MATRVQSINQQSPKSLTLGIYNSADAQSLFDWWTPSNPVDRTRLLAHEFRRRIPGIDPLAIVYESDGSLFGITPVGNGLYGFALPPIRSLGTRTGRVMFQKALFTLAADLTSVLNVEQLQGSLSDFLRRVSPSTKTVPIIIALPPEPLTAEPESDGGKGSIMRGLLSTYKDQSFSHIQVNGRHRPPQPAEVKRLVSKFMPLLFPGYHGPRATDRGFEGFICRQVSLLQQLLTRLVVRAIAFRQAVEGWGSEVKLAALRDQVDNLVLSFFQRLPDIRRDLEADVQAAKRNDPALRELDPQTKTIDHHEILLAYPGLWAVAVYRLGHALDALGVPYLPRMMTEFAHSKTGIDIHPKASIGPAFFIDHGTGVVIGQTTIIESGVTLYQGVTLGSLNFPVTDDGEYDREKKRHPTIRKDCTIYANAAVLGDIEVAEGTEIGANVSLRVSILDPQSRVRMPHTLRELKITGKPSILTAAEIVRDTLLKEVSPSGDPSEGRKHLNISPEVLKDYAEDPEGYLNEVLQPVTESVQSAVT
jgi:serine O-acetyltransferase